MDPRQLRDELEVANARVPFAEAARALGITTARLWGLVGTEIRGVAARDGGYWVPLAELEAFARRGGIAALRAVERERADAFKRATAAIEAKRKRMQAAEVPPALARADAALRRAKGNDYRRRLAQARRDGAEQEFLKAERAKLARRKQATAEAEARAARAKRTAAAGATASLKKTRAVAEAARKTGRGDA